MFQYRTAHSKKDFDTAINLVEQTYRLEQYIPTDSEKPNPISLFLNRCGSATILAFEESNLRGTISIVKDSDRGLPMDCSFKKELDSLRGKGYKLAEVCQFSTDQRITKENGSGKQGSTDTSVISLGLFTHVIHLALKHELFYLCFSVNKKHERFYQILGCSPLSELRSYSLANDAPSRAFLLNLHDLIENKSSSPILQKVLSVPVDTTDIALDVFEQGTLT